MAQSDVPATMAAMVSQRLVAILVDKGVLAPTDAQELYRSVAAAARGQKDPVNAAVASFCDQLAKTYQVPNKTN